ncbi:hypothetical protein P3S67_025893 [Capsicum chacoense]
MAILIFSCKTNVISIHGASRQRLKWHSSISCKPPRESHFAPNFQVSIIGIFASSALHWAKNGAPILEFHSRDLESPNRKLQEAPIIFANRG